MRSDKAAIAASRFGLGATPQEAGEIGNEPVEWLEAQLAKSSVSTSNRTNLSADVLVRVSELRLARRVQARNQSGEPPEIDRDMLREYAQYIGSEYRAQAGRRYELAIESETPFRERLVHFWANHFAISTDKQPLGALAGHYENEAIRPNVTGNFATMLLAVEQHPAMILYLDNQASIGPNSLAARIVRRRRDREIGLNENLAREILELHTLGVDGGYQQADVTEFARVLTGWSVGADTGPQRGGDPGEFHFRNAVHEPGDKTIMGLRYRESGIDEGLEVLAKLAMHPSTAHHLALKLARHFVCDAPPAAVVERLSAAYLDSGGELLPVYHSLLQARESWQEPLTKYKTPHDFVISTYRALNYTATNAAQIIGILTQLGQPPMRPGSPAGWPDSAAHWDGGDALLKRIEWAVAVGRAAGNSIDPLALGNDILGPVLGEHSYLGIQRAESTSQGLALLLASPEFQRR